MLFGNRDKKMSQMKAAMEETASELLQAQTQELTRIWEDQSRSSDQAAEKNYRALRSLSDTVEDFLDSLQERDRNSLHMEQMLAEAEQREQGLLALVELYREQMELFERWLIGQESETGGGAGEAWQQQYAMLKGKIAAEEKLCAIEYTGAPGEPVDYRLHEILQAAEPETKEQEGTIAKVYSQGMVYRGSVVKKARVRAYVKA